MPPCLVALPYLKSFLPQRRAINSAFSALALVDYRQHVFEVAKNIISSLQTMCNKGRNGSVQMNALSLSALFTIDVFGKVALGHDFNSSSEHNVSQDVKSKEIKAFEFLLDDLVLRCNPSRAFICHYNYIGSLQSEIDNTNIIGESSKSSWR